MTAGSAALSQAIQKKKKLPKGKMIIVAIKSIIIFFSNGVSFLLDEAEHS